MAHTRRPSKGNTAANTINPVRFTHPAAGQVKIGSSSDRLRCESHADNHQGANATATSNPVRLSIQVHANNAPARASQRQ